MLKILLKMSDSKKQDQAYPYLPTRITALEKSEVNKLAYPDLLNGYDVFIALLDYGMLPRELPACFTSKGLEGVLKIVKVNIKGKLSILSRDYICYPSPRAKCDLIPRDLSIPHPLVYSKLCEEIRDNWTTLNKKSYVQNKKNYTHVKKIEDKSHIFEMNYSDLHGEEDAIVKLQLGAKYCANVDISRCYPSIYTHTVAWALEGRTVSQKSKNDKNLLGNKLDRCLMNMNNNNSTGILVGRMRRILSLN